MWTCKCMYGQGYLYTQISLLLLWKTEHKNWANIAHIWSFFLATSYPKLLPVHGYFLPSYSLSTLVSHMNTTSSQQPLLLPNTCIPQACIWMSSSQSWGDRGFGADHITWDNKHNLPSMPFEKKYLSLHCKMFYFLEEFDVDAFFVWGQVPCQKNFINTSGINKGMYNVHVSSDINVGSR